MSDMIMKSKEIPSIKQGKGPKGSRFAYMLVLERKVGE